MGRSRADKTPVGSGITLRPVTLADLDCFKTWWAEPEANRLDSGVAREAPGGHFLDEIGRLIIGGGLPTWRMVEAEGAGPVGYALYRGYDRVGKSAEMAIRIGLEHWGKGYGTAATRLLLDYLFETLRVRRVWLEVVDFNERAIRMYRKVGFRETSRIPAQGDRPGIVTMEVRRSSPSDRRRIV
ncbi:MAG TPA: GNAT family N-acetyltransferase [Bacillota bacterium]